MEEYKNIIGERIKKLRKEAKLTQEELSTRLGLNNKSSISQYEKGDIIPSDKIKIKLCNLFNCSIDYLMGVTNIREPIDGLNTSNLDEESKKHAYNVCEAMQKQKELDKDEQEFRFAYHKEMEGLTDEEIVNALRFYKEMKAKINKNNN